MHPHSVPTLSVSPHPTGTIFPNAPAPPASELSHFTHLPALSPVLSSKPCLQPCLVLGQFNLATAAVERLLHGWGEAPCPVAKPSKEDGEWSCEWMWEHGDVQEGYV